MILLITRKLSYSLKFVARFYYRDIVADKISLPIIKTPLNLMRKTSKIRQRNLERLANYRRMYGVDPKRDRVIIRCDDPKMNHYLNQKYPPNRPILLASRSWGEKSHAGETLVINQRTKAAATFFPEDIPFDEFHLCDEVLRVLREKNFERATDVQSLVIPKMLSNDTNAIIAAETGSGKTLAYLLPLITNLLMCREKFGAPEPFLPRAVVFAPSRELSAQIFRTLSQLIGYTKLNAVHLSSMFDYRECQELELILVFQLQVTTFILKLLKHPPTLSLVLPGEYKNLNELVS